MNYRIDKEYAYNAMYNYTKEEFPEKSNEFCTLIATQRTKDSIRFALQRYITDKLHNYYSFDYGYASRKAEHIMKNLPEELFPNVEEWLNDKPISEIRYGDLSIKELMDFGKDRRGRQNSFLKCIELMIIYIQRGCTYKGRCFQAFMNR